MDLQMWAAVFGDLLFPSRRTAAEGSIFGPESYENKKKAYGLTAF